MMIKEQLFEDLYDKLPDVGNFVIFGACATGEKILNDLKIYKPLTKVIGFIDNAVDGTFCSLPVWTLKEFTDFPKENYDMVIMGTRKDFSTVNSILDLYDIPFLIQTPFISDYYRDVLQVLNENNLEKVINIFEEKEDKDLYKLIFKIRAKLTNPQLADDYFRQKHVLKENGNFTIKNQYLEKINKNQVKIAFDLGLNSGLNVIAYNKLLPNLEKTYGFEVIYDYAKCEWIEKFILDGRLNIIPFALGNEEKVGNFYLNKQLSVCSYCDFSNNNPPADMAKWEKIQINATTMDKFCCNNNIMPDFIKMDIEGAEMPALEGGMKTIQECRPQLAISIYHSNEDFINIPLYLNKNLKNYHFKLGHYSPWRSETVLYAIPQEIKF
ncbi:MAG: FkbM family methyltransferase [Acinetobacter sp.]|nr:FkbM family methyltransferase [Acinetobacter sp.]